MYATGLIRSAPDFAPVLWSSSSGMLSNIPPTRPSFARNSSMIWALKSSIDVDISVSSLSGRDLDCFAPPGPAHRQRLLGVHPHLPATGGRVPRVVEAVRP